MIDTQIFAHWMGVLSDRFNRPLAAPTQRAYFEVLSRQLTTAEFIAGAERCFEVCTFWPGPKEIADAAKPIGDTELAGAELFAEVLRWNGRPQLMAEAERRLPAPALRAFLAAGGPGKFRTLTEAEAPFVRKAFIAAYVAAAADAAESERAGEAVARVEARHHHALEASRDPARKRLSTGPQRIGELLPMVLP